jgi:DNA-binding transcriptional regulator YiaG
MPTTLKTPGDCILAKRFEKGLTPCQLASMLHVPLERLKQLENDAEAPTQAEWTALISALSLESGFIQWKPNI